MNAVKFFKLALRFHVLPWAGVLAAVWIAGWMVLLSPLVRAGASADKEIQGYQARINDTQGVVSGTPDLTAQLKKLTEELEYLRKLTLKRGEKSRVISAVTAAADANKIKISKIRPHVLPAVEDAKKEGKRLIPSPFIIDMEAEYQALGEFFESLETQPVLLTLEEMTAAPVAGSSNTLTVSLVVSALEEWTPEVPPGMVAAQI